ncbi:MAG: membrane protein insertase YidC [Gammaproteobacteria bacterium]
MTANPRIFLWIGLALVLWLNYEAWMRDYGAPAVVAPVVSTSTNGSVPSTATPGGSLGTGVPQASTSSPSADKGAATPAAAGSAAPLPSSPLEAATAGTSADSGKIRVRTDVLDLDISLQGGTFERADLLRYPKVKGGSELVRLMNGSADTLYLLQTGLTGPADSEHPTHLSTFTSAQSDYQLGSGSELRVPLVWTDGKGVTVTKTYIFTPGSYRIGLEYQVENHSSAPWQAAMYAQILRNDPATQRSMFTTNVETYAFHGPAMYDGTKYRKLKITDEEDKKLSVEVSNGWIAALQHHFVGAVIPAPNEPYRLTLNAQGQEFRLTAAGPLKTVAEGQSAKLDQTLFVGPKLQAQLEKAGPRLELAADYGKYLTVLAKPLFWLLGKVHVLFNNWGWAIICVTFLLKLLFYPLSEASGRSMAKMKMLGPRIKSLQESYKEDREKLGRAMMDLYKREKVNPVAGCLPMIIQIPVFLAFYWVLLESVEMRQAPFAGWINDLSSRDPFFVLPAIMAAAMFTQYKLNPAPPDPIQAKVFMIMPFAMSLMFAFFPAGLVLYWVTNTLLSILQQWNINRRIEAAKKV